MKKSILIILLPSLILLAPLNASAATGVLYGDRDINIKFPNSAQFYDLPTSTTYQSISTRSSQKYYNNVYELPVNTSSGYGGLVCFETDNLMIPGQTYALTIYIGALNNDFVFQDVYVQSGQLHRVSTGSTLNLAASYYSNNNVANTFYNYWATTSLKLSFANIEGNTTLYSGVRYVTFEPTIVGPNVCIDFSTVSTYSFFGLYGYNIYSLGPTSSSIANQVSADIGTELGNVVTTQDLSTAVTNINTKLAATEKAITEEQKKTNEKLDDINDTLNNDDVDTDGASGFFDSFQNTDHGGISGVVTAPLNFINKLGGTCDPLNIPFFDEYVTLPCGDTLFWGREDVKSFRITWNVLFGGAFLYGAMVLLFKTIERLKNPDDDRIEVMKL